MKNLKIKMFSIQEMNTDEMKTKNGGCDNKRFYRIAYDYYATGATNQDLIKEMFRCIKSWGLDPSKIVF